MGLWHRVRYNYFALLYEDCLDEEIRRKLKEKIEYHERKLR